MQTSIQYPTPERRTPTEPARKRLPQPIERGGPSSWNLQLDWRFCRPRGFAAVATTSFRCTSNPTIVLVFMEDLSGAFVPERVAFSNQYGSIDSCSGLVGSLDNSYKRDEIPVSGL